MRAPILLALAVTTACDPAWLETPTAEHQRQVTEHITKLEQTLAALPGIQRASVLYTAPTGLAAVPETLAPAKATVLLVRTATAPSAAQPAHTLAASALPAADIQVIETERPAPEPGAPALTQFGPITVTRASAPTLKAWLGAALCLQMLLAAAVLRPLLRRRRRP